MPIDSLGKSLDSYSKSRLTNRFSHRLGSSLWTFLLCPKDTYSSIEMTLFHFKTIKCKICLSNRLIFTCIAYSYWWDLLNIHFQHSSEQIFDKMQIELYTNTPIKSHKHLIIFQLMSSLSFPFDLIINALIAIHALDVVVVDSNEMQMWKYSSLENKIKCKAMKIIPNFIKNYRLKFIRFIFGSCCCATCCIIKALMQYTFSICIIIVITSLLVMLLNWYNVLLICWFVVHFSANFVLLYPEVDEIHYIITYALLN